MDQRSSIDEKHDVATYGDRTADDHDGSTGFNLVGEVGAEDNGKEGGHVGGNGEELGFGSGVAKGADYRRKEQRKGVYTANVSLLADISVGSGVRGDNCKEIETEDDGVDVQNSQSDPMP